MQAFTDLIYCLAGPVSQLKFIIYCLPDWFTFFMISGVYRILHGKCARTVFAHVLLTYIAEGCDKC